MDRRIFGLETEFGVTCASTDGRGLSADEVARYLFRKVVAWGRSSNVFLSNGSRLYLDVGSHPEYATAECDDVRQLVVHDKAGERVLEPLDEAPGYLRGRAVTEIALSAKQHNGLERLREHLKACLGYQPSEGGVFLARRRHLDALEKAEAHMQRAHECLFSTKAGELAAEELRYAQRALGEITGQFTADDLLGRIFSSFCIGK